MRQRVKPDELTVMIVTQTQTEQNVAQKSAYEASLHQQGTQNQLSEIQRDEQRHERVAVHVKREQPFHVIVVVVVVRRRRRRRRPRVMTSTTPTPTATFHSHVSIRQKPIRRRDDASAPDVIETHRRKDHPNRFPHASSFVHRAIPDRTCSHEKRRQHAKRRIVSSPLVFRLFSVRRVTVHRFWPAQREHAHLPQRVGNVHVLRHHDATKIVIDDSRVIRIRAARKRKVVCWRVRPSSSSSCWGKGRIIDSRRRRRARFLHLLLLLCVFSQSARRRRRRRRKNDVKILNKYWGPLFFLYILFQKEVL